MANAARMHAVENGEDLSDYTMIAFGGAAPLHAARLCQKLDISKFLVPSGAGVGSAIGFLRAPFSFEASKSIFMPLKKFDQRLVCNIIDNLREEAVSFVKSCGIEEEIITGAKAYMRYSGQGWEIPVTLQSIEPSEITEKNFQNAFEEQYKLLFGRLVQGPDIEITVWSLNASAGHFSEKVIKVTEAKDESETINTRYIFDPGLDDFTIAKVLERKFLTDKKYLEGPAVIVEDETTIIVPTGFFAQGNIDNSIAVKRIKK